MSTDRASSAVRNLRAKFEQKDTPEASPSQGRGRSPLGLRNDSTNGTPGRPLSKVRASFVAVDQPSGGQMAAMEDGAGGGMAELKMETSAGLRRGSFSVSEESDGNALAELNNTVSGEHEGREADSKVSETIPEFALEATPTVTPNAKATQDNEMEHAASKLDGMSLANGDGEPENPDKPTTGAQQDPSEMKPADPTSEDAVSRGEALRPKQEDLRQHETPKTNGVSPHKTKSTPSNSKAPVSPSKSKSLPQKPAETRKLPNGKPTPVSTKAPSKAASSSLKSPMSQPRTPSSANAPSAASPKASKPRDPTKKASRSSLTAPTAASVARAAGADRQSLNSTKASSPPKAKPRDNTRPADVSSRLTAPTAASRAKHEPEGAAAKPTMNGKVSTSSKSTSATSRPKPAPTSARPTPRTSLQRPESRQAQAAPKRAPPGDGSFLERMMRPTAASEQKKHEKTEAKSPPHANGPARAGSVMKKPRGGVSKINGVMKSAANAQKARDEHARSTAGSRPTTSGSATTSSKPGSSGSEKKSITGDPSRLQQHKEENMEDLADETKATGQQVKAEQSLAHGPDKVEEKADGMPGNETPVPQTNGQVNSVMEGTPAFDEEGIR